MTEEHDDISIETDDLDDSVVSEEAQGEQIKKLRSKLRKAVEEKQQLFAELQRAKADFVNLRKRDEDEKRELVKFANQALAEELIPVLESFDMARGNREAWEKVDKNWRQGIEYIHSQLLKILESHNVKEISPVGEIFDPNIHEAVEYVPTDNQSDDHKVMAVLQKGYLLSGKVLKPAKVKVGEFKQS